MRRLLLALFLAIGAAAPAFAATCPAFTYGYVLTAAQWQACFDAKQSTLGYVPVNKAGDVMTGRLVMPAPSGARASFNLTPGTAPSNPTDGDIWITGTTVGARVNGVTISLISPDISNITGLGAGVATFLSTPSSANLAAAVTGETGSGALVFGTSPTLVTPSLGVANATSMALNGSSSGSIVLSAPAAAGSNTLKFPAGSTDFTATGGTGQYLKQSSTGAALTVGTIAAADLPIVANASGAPSATAGAAKCDGVTTTCSSGVISSTTFVAASKAQQQTGTSNVVSVTPLHQQDHDSAIKAWIYVTQSGGTYTTAASYNASASKTGTGVLTLTWTTAFATTAYGVTCSLNQTLGGQTISENESSRLSGSVSIQIRNASNTNTDSSFSCIAFGRQ